ncbi:hypothetical protein PAXRUDRAFT_594475 [Paxillus rubicundulus Ve08.2h10]|uniref:Uncharacterized protein n=1 Tax=Paxillus rubicundulus Ve08.2h10 TaxID=930991 RepID=A0A0D0DTS7_9AGAM|nr:hypothetical protein PAXRUDRAFT_594475 [Paxillus rubicundulus Ve08.2h10]
MEPIQIVIPSSYQVLLSLLSFQGYFYPYPTLLNSLFHILVFVNLFHLLSLLASTSTPIINTSFPFQTPQLFFALLRQ